MRIPLWIKVLWTACVIAWVPVYWRQYGPQNFLFFCDLGNLLYYCRSLAGECVDIFLAGKRAAALPDSLHSSILRGRFVSGRHLIGGTEYMFDPHIPLSIRLLSLFHVVTPPLLLWAILSSGLRPARLEISDADRVDRGSDQLFLASGIRCELGSWTLLSRTACSARTLISFGISDYCSRGNLLSHSPFSLVCGLRGRTELQNLVFAPGILSVILSSRVDSKRAQSRGGLSLIYASAILASPFRFASDLARRVRAQIQRLR